MTRKKKAAKPKPPSDKRLADALKEAAELAHLLTGLCLRIEAHDEAVFTQDVREWWARRKQAIADDARLAQARKLAEAERAVEALKEQLAAAETRRAVLALAPEGQAGG